MVRAMPVVGALLIVSVLLGAGAAAGAPAQNPKLFGTVTPEATIILRDAQGNRVTKLDPGTYDIEVDDSTNEHNFHLTGPGVNRTTTVEGTGKVTWTVTFTDGNYTYVCDPHSAAMRGTFTVGTPPTTTPPASGPITAKTRLQLVSGPRRTITLRTAAGKPVTAMRLGTYTMVVRDRSRVHNARVRAPGYNRATTVPFVGTQTWKVRLARTGTLRFLCDPHAASGMRGTARIVR